MGGWGERATDREKWIGADFDACLQVSPQRAHLRPCTYRYMFVHVHVSYVYI